MMIYLFLKINFSINKLFDNVNTEFPEYWSWAHLQQSY
jgi:hypothetical protein